MEFSATPLASSLRDLAVRLRPPSLNSALPSSGSAHSFPGFALARDRFAQRNFASALSCPGIALAWAEPSSLGRLSPFLGRYGTKRGRSRGKRGRKRNKRGKVSPKRGTCAPSRGRDAPSRGTWRVCVGRKPRVLGPSQGTHGINPPSGGQRARSCCGSRNSVPLKASLCLWQLRCTLESMDQTPDQQEVRRLRPAPHDDADARLLEPGDRAPDGAQSRLRQAGSSAATSRRSLSWSWAPRGRSGSSPTSSSPSPTPSCAPSTWRAPPPGRSAPCSKTSGRSAAVSCAQLRSPPEPCRRRTSSP